MRVRIVLSRGQELLRECSIEGETTIVGRNPACDVVVDDITVSKRHLKLELRDGTLQVEDLGSRNGMRVNGLQVKRQALQHLDVVEFGNHKIHVFDEALLPEAGISGEATVARPVEGTGREIAEPSVNPPIPQFSPQSAPHLEETQPTTASASESRAYGLKSLDEMSGEILRLDQPRTLVGPPGRSALIVRRRDAIYLTRLSRELLRVNDRDVGATPSTLHPGDIIEIGPARYQLVSLGT